MIFKKYNLRIMAMQAPVIFNFVMNPAEKNIARISVLYIERPGEQLACNSFRITAAQHCIYKSRMKVNNIAVINDIMQIGFDRWPELCRRISTAGIQVSLDLLFPGIRIAAVFLSRHFTQPGTVHNYKPVLTNGCQSGTAGLDPQPLSILK